MNATATTTEALNPASALPGADLQALPPGTYNISEDLPESDAGTWSFVSYTCGLQRTRVRRTAPEVPVVTIPASGGQICTFTNQFTPTGSITIYKETLGGFGTAQFTVSPLFGEARDYQQAATTSDSENPAKATGQSTAHLPLGRYTIHEAMATNSLESGDWKLAAVECDGVPVPSTSGVIPVLLTEGDPSAVCTFTNELLPPPEPEPEPTPGPPLPDPLPLPTPLPSNPVNVQEVLAAFAQARAADLVVTKTATPTRVTLGRSVRYRVTVRNRGEGIARLVTLHEQQPRASRRLNVVSSKGRCRGTPPRFCVLGALEPGERATVTVTLRPQRTGRFRNTVAVNTGHRSGRRTRRPPRR